MWPGYGENCRVLDWILRRIDNEPGTAQPTPIGNVPTRESFDVRGLNVDFDGLFSVPIDFWTEEVSRRSRYSDIDGSRFIWFMHYLYYVISHFQAKEVAHFLYEQVDEDLPKDIQDQINNLFSRLSSYSRN